MSESTTIDIPALPSAIRDFLADSTGADRPQTIRFFADDVRVDDQGESFAGRDEVQAWLTRTTGMFVYTLEIESAEQRGEGTYAVRNHLRSEVFPNGETWSTFVFEVTDGLISHLTFE